MKRILRTYIFYLVALWVTDQLLGNSLVLPEDPKTLFLAGGILALLNVLLKPILGLLFLPISALTLGLFQVVINAGVFYLFLRLVPQVSISAWTFPGFAVNGLSLPQTTLPYFGTLLVASAAISIITNFLAYLVE